MGFLEALFWLGVAAFLTWQALGSRRAGDPLPSTAATKPARLGRLRQDRDGDELQLYFRAHSWNRGKRILVEPETEGHREARTRGLQDIQVGRDLFDHAFLVRSNDTRLALRVLDERIQGWALTLARLAEGGTVHLRLEPLVVEVRKELPGRALDPEEQHLLEEGARAWGEAVYAALTGAPAEHAAPPPGAWAAAGPEDPMEVSGVEFGGVELQVGGDCQLCGDSIEADAKRCSYCGLPHHQDCWDFQGGCTTYGCPGTP